MDFSTDGGEREADLVDLVTATFSASEGAGEGALVGGLARALLSETAPDDLRVFTASDGGVLVGAAIFTRLRYPEDPRTVFLLSPMAVATDRQGQGVGQALLRHALAELRADGVDVAITYGDPAFYGKVGFLPLTEDVAAAPLPLHQPEGWIGQSLTGAPLKPLAGPCSCVEALNDPRLW